MSTPDAAWQQRLALLLVFIADSAKLYHELYENGGRHVKDLDKARMCDTLLVLGSALFPELDLDLPPSSETEHLLASPANAARLSEAIARADELEEG